MFPFITMKVTTIDVTVPAAAIKQKNSASIGDVLHHTLPTVIIIIKLTTVEVMNGSATAKNSFVKSCIVISIKSVSSLHTPNFSRETFIS